MRAIAAATGVDFALDVVLDGEQRIVRAFGGELFAMHRAACELSRRSAMRAVPAPFDVVVTSNAGFPLDQNLYQAVKGMSAAAQVVRDGGTIVCAAECRDGFPDHGSFRDELTQQPTPEKLAEAIGRRTRTVPDQWQVQVQANIQRRARVVMHTSYLSAEELEGAHLESTDDVTETVREALHAAGGDARVCVLPGRADHDPICRLSDERSRLRTSFAARSPPGRRLRRSQPGPRVRAGRASSFHLPTAARARSTRSAARTGSRAWPDRSASRWTRAGGSTTRLP